jgi:hypothetical protein
MLKSHKLPDEKETATVDGTTAGIGKANVFVYLEV